MRKSTSKPDTAGQRPDTPPPQEKTRRPGLGRGCKERRVFNLVEMGESGRETRI